jgi:Flp pilus assembly protein TadG
MIAQGKNEKIRQLGRRQAAALTVLVVLALPALLAVLFLAVNVARLAEAKATLRNNADADALAAVQCLVDDSWLTGLPSAQLNLIELARSQAQFYASVNKVLGQPLDLQMPTVATANPADGDVVFAFLDQPRSQVLVVADLNGAYNGSPFLPMINTVRVSARRLRSRGAALGLFGGGFTGIGTVDSTTPATATLDRDVVGFQAVGDQPIPLVPIGLLTRASVPARGMPSSWENELARGLDNWTLDPATGLFAAGSDYLAEAAMVLTMDESLASAAVLFPAVGRSGQSTFTDQIAAGMSANDLQGLGGTFALSDVDNRLSVPASRGAATPYSDLAGQLNQLQGQKRIWPLYESFDPAGGQAIVAGFVAARVVQASATTTGLTLVLQPCMLSTRTALTNAARRGVGGVDIVNPYICKVRLVE